MTVHRAKDSRTYRYSFYIARRRYFGSTGQRTLQAAREWEAVEKRRIRELLAGRGAPVEADGSPRFQDWAEVYFAHAQTRLTRPSRVEHLLRVILRFFGERPQRPDHAAYPTDPYHDLRLLDPIRDPDWLVQFEDWMAARGIAGQTKNQYRSTLRQMYQLARQPRWRKLTGVQTNPLDGIFRDRPGGREVTIAPEDLRRLLEHASYHVRLAVAIGALAPKLRLGNILALTWDGSLDPALRFITVSQHKTAAITRRPLVLPVSRQLRAILEDARRRAPGQPFVIAYRGRPIKSLRAGLKAAAKAAGVPYGRSLDNGMTFHSLRHTAATLLAELDVGEAKRKSVMGHQYLGTTQKYTHLRPVHEVAAIEQLSETLPLEDLVTAPWRRANRPVQAAPATATPTPTGTLGHSSTAAGRTSRRSNV